jgi:hypothetical protein
MSYKNSKALVLLVWIAWLCLSKQQPLPTAEAAAAHATGLQDLHEHLQEKVMAFYYVW